jgi:hypothetical protein
MCCKALVHDWGREFFLQDPTNILWHFYQKFGYPFALFSFDRRDKTSKDEPSVDIYWVDAQIIETLRSKQ